LHLVEIKSYWGAEYKEDHNQDRVKTVNKVYWDVFNKCEKAQTELEHHLKLSYNGFQIRVESNSWVVLSL
jgi:hypothetical protein